MAVWLPESAPPPWRTPSFSGRVSLDGLEKESPGRRQPLSPPPLGSNLNPMIPVTNAREARIGAAGRGVRIRGSTLPCAQGGAGVGKQS